MPFTPFDGADLGYCVSPITFPQLSTQVEAKQAPSWRWSVFRCSRCWFFFFLVHCWVKKLIWLKCTVFPFKWFHSFHCFFFFHKDCIFLCHLIYPLTVRVVGAPQMISQPVSSIFPCSPLPSWTWQTPSLSIPWCCLSTSSSVCLVFFPFSLCLARLFWPDLMNGRHDHTIAVYISLPWSRGLRVVQLHAGSWHRLPHW